MSEREIEAALRLVRPEKAEAFPLGALQAVRTVRRYLEDVESLSIERALGLGASAEDIADALGISRQGVYYKLRRLADRAEVVVPEEGAAVEA